MECLEYFDSKNMWFYGCENKPYVVATIIENMPRNFAKFILTCCFNSSSLLFNLTQME